MNNLKLCQERNKKLAFLKHELMVNKRIQTNPRKAFELEEQVLMIGSNYSFSFIRVLNELLSTLFAIRLNSNFQAPFWSNFLTDLFKLLNDLGDSLSKNLSLRDKLVLLYVWEFDRLTHPIGTAEFSQILGWDKRKFASYCIKGYIPEPVQILASTLYGLLDKQSSSCWY